MTTPEYGHLPIVVTLDYGGVSRLDEGAFSELLPRLVSITGATYVRVEDWPGCAAPVLWLRQGAKRLFRITLVRRAGRQVVELAGVEPRRVLKAVGICRDHFDRWFSITPEVVRMHEARQQRRQSERPEVD